MYDAYQGMADVGDRVRQLAQNAHMILGAWAAHPTASPWRRMSAYYELVALAGFTHARPDYGIDSVEVNGAPIPVEERGVLWTPFCQLLHFRKAGGADDPKILLVAPMSGHFATLLRGTIRTLLRDHQVYITDWIVPRRSVAKWPDIGATRRIFGSSSPPVFRKWSSWQNGVQSTPRSSTGIAAPLISTLSIP